MSAWASGAWASGAWAANSWQGMSGPSASGLHLGYWKHYRGKADSANHRIQIGGPFALFKRKT